MRERKKRIANGQSEKEKNIHNCKWIDGLIALNFVNLCVSMWKCIVISGCCTYSVHCIRLRADIRTLHWLFSFILSWLFVCDGLSDVHGRMHRWFLFVRRSTYSKKKKRNKLIINKRTTKSDNSQGAQIRKLAHLSFAFRRKRVCVFFLYVRENSLSDNRSRIKNFFLLVRPFFTLASSGEARSFFGFGRKFGCYFNQIPRSFFLRLLFASPLDSFFVVVSLFLLIYIFFSPFHIIVLHILPANDFLHRSNRTRTEGKERKRKNNNELQSIAMCVMYKRRKNSNKSKNSYCPRKRKRRRRKTTES